MTNLTPEQRTEIETKCVRWAECREDARLDEFICCQACHPLPVLLSALTAALADIADLEQRLDDAEREREEQYKLATEKLAGECEYCAKHEALQAERDRYKTAIRHGVLECSRDIGCCDLCDVTRFDNCWMQAALADQQEAQWN